MSLIFHPAGQGLSHIYFVQKLVRVQNGEPGPGFKGVRVTFSQLVRRHDNVYTPMEGPLGCLLVPLAKEGKIWSAGEGCLTLCLIRNTVQLRRYFSPRCPPLHRDDVCPRSYPHQYAVRSHVPSFIHRHLFSICWASPFEVYLILLLCRSASAHNPWRSQ